ncbi:MAG: Abi family protein [Alphaproteobacteria bacterium]|nr:Abi family protein [Alphaproteobacteria bacterium]
MKVYKTIKEQINLLESRDLIINNKDFAENLLGNVSYYRLVAYRHDTPFYDKNSKKYNNNATIEDLKKIYEQDNFYKSLLYYILQMIEVSFRTQLIYNFSKNDSYFYIKEDNFKFTGKGSDKRKTEFFNKICRAVRNDNNIHICFYQEQHDVEVEENKLDEHCNYRKDNCKTSYTKCNCKPESWVAFEDFDFGTLIELYSKLNDDIYKTEKEVVAKFFGVEKAKYLTQILEDIRRTRNIVAHHDKIISRYSFKESCSIKFLKQYYLNNHNQEIVSLLDKEIQLNTDKRKNNVNQRITTRQSSTFLPYFLVIKYFLDVLYSQGLILEHLGLDKDIVQEFLDISKDSHYKDFLSLDGLSDNVFILQNLNINKN